MQSKCIVLLCILILSQIPASADNSIYIVSNNTISKDNIYKIVLDTKILSDILIDNQSIYFYTQNFEYIANSTTGNISHKIYIPNIQKQKLSDDYIFVMAHTKIYKINKSNGIIEQKTLYNFNLNNIYSIGFPGNSTNNYNITNIISGSIDDNSKVNKTGDTMTGALDINTIYNSTDVSIIAGSSILTANVGLHYGYDFTSIFDYSPYTNLFTHSTDVNMAGNEMKNSSYIRFQNSTTNGMYWAGGSRLYEQSITYGSSNNRMIYQPNGDKIDILNEAGSTYTFRVRPEGLLSYTGIYVGVNSSGSLPSVPTNGLYINQSLQIGSLSGSGNSYACIDSEGKLYRSDVACV